MTDEEQIQIKLKKFQLLLEEIKVAREIAKKIKDNDQSIYRRKSELGNQRS